MSYSSYSKYNQYRNCCKPIGAQGAQGAEGAQGFPGYTGSTGFGVTGPQGDTGIQGPQGPQGAQGTSGKLGPIGPQGLQGELGPEGDPGPIGPQGLHGPQGPVGPQGKDGGQGPPGFTGPEGQSNILVCDDDQEVTIGDNIVFNQGALNAFEYTGAGYRYSGQKEDALMVVLNVQYRSISTTVPYEIVVFVLKVNGVQRFKRKYGFDMQERIKDEFLIDIDPNDVVEFVLDSLHNSSDQAVIIEEKSFVILKTLQLYKDISQELPT